MSIRTKTMTGTLIARGEDIAGSLVHLA